MEAKHPAPIYQGRPDAAPGSVAGGKDACQTGSGVCSYQKRASVDEWMMDDKGRGRAASLATIILTQYFQ